MFRNLVILAACAMLGCSAAPAAADPGTLDFLGPPGAPPTPDAGPPPPPPGDQSMPPAPSGAVDSAPPVTTKSPDGSTLFVSARNESELEVPSLTDEAATREYIVGGVFNGSVHVPAGGPAPHGVLERVRTASMTSTWSAAAE
jgi:hypothetical protein